MLILVISNLVFLLTGYFIGKQQKPKLPEVSFKRAKADIIEPEIDLAQKEAEKLQREVLKNARQS